MATLNDPEEAQALSNQVDTPYLTSWCGGMGCDNCKLCLIFSGKAELIKANDRTHTLTYRVRQCVNCGEYEQLTKST